MKNLLKIIAIFTIAFNVIQAKDVSIETNKDTDTSTELEKFLGKGEKDKGLSLIFAGYANHSKKKCSYCKGGKLNETINMIGFKYAFSEHFGFEYHNFKNSYHVNTHYLGAYAKYNFYKKGNLRTFIKISAGIQKGYKNWKMDFSEGNDDITPYYMPSIGINYNKLTLETIITHSKEHGTIMLGTLSWKPYN